MQAGEEGGLFRTAGSWIGDFAIDHWPSLAVAASSIAMTILAYLSRWTHAYGPVAYGGTALAALLVTALIFWLIAHARNTLEAARYRRVLTTLPPTTNPLRSHFQNEKLRLSDFFGPLSPVNEAKTFEGCEIHGPATMVLLDHCTLDNCNFNHCDLIAVPSGVRVYTAAGFRKSTFRSCRFVSATILLPIDSARALRDELAKNPASDPQKIIGLAE